MSGNRTQTRTNYFDSFRVLFATLVLLAHAPEFTDGNRSRELFARITHADQTFGSLAVTGFFLLSGYLIVQSWETRPEVKTFMLKRFLRIVPGYLAAVILSVIFVGWLAPATPHYFHEYRLWFLKSVILLTSPLSPPVLPHMSYPIVNGSLWTIAYEFRCYLLVAVLGIAGFVRRRGLWAVTTVVAGLLSFHRFGADTSSLGFKLEQLLGSPDQTFRLDFAFLVGGVFFLFKDRIPLRLPLAIAAAILLALATQNARTVEPAFAVCGGYLLFYIASLPTRRGWPVYHFTDISYGIYLYGWPVEALWVYYFRGSPWITFAAAVCICSVLGLLSWLLVEKPALRLKPRGSSTAPLSDSPSLQ